MYLKFKYKDTEIELTVDLGVPAHAVSNYSQNSQDPLLTVIDIL